MTIARLRRSRRAAPGSSSPTTSTSGLRASAAAAITAAARLGLSACSGTGAGTGEAAAGEGAAASQSTTATGDEQQWPRTVAVGEGEVTVAEQPARIVALSTETADLALQLVGPERVAAVPKAATDPASGNQVELAGQVATTLASGTHPDPEQILSLNPDLVILTGRHDSEQSASDLLAGSGVPTATFTAADFSSPDRVAAAVDTMGRLLGAEDTAADLRAGLDREVRATVDAVADVTERPSTIVLFQRGGKQMILASTSATPNLVELAGGESLAAREGWRSAVAADPETILRLDPQVIIIQDFRGAGRGPFEALLRNPALAEVRAIADDRVVSVDARTTSGTAGTRLSEGLRTIAEALHPGSF